MRKRHGPGVETGIRQQPQPVGAPEQALDVPIVLHVDRAVRRPQEEG
jgi:hypothetical protein